MNPRPAASGYAVTTLQWAVFGLMLWLGWIQNRPDGPPWLSTAGGVLMALSMVPVTLGLFHLGRNLSPWPHPRASNRLVTHGIYSHLRHPLYASLLLFAVGWILWRQSWPAFIVGGALFLILRHKAAREEKMLQERHPDYRDYARGTGGFFPAWRAPRKAQPCAAEDQ